MREVIKDIPKPMAPVKDKPFLEYLILQLSKWGIKEIVLSVGYKKDNIKSYFVNGRKWGVNIEYSEENEPLGTGGALKKALKLIDEEQFIAMNGDSLIDLNFKDFLTFHNDKRGEASICLLYTDNVSRFGKVKVDSNNEVIDFAEKSGVKDGLINGGVYIFNRCIDRCIAEGRTSLENDVLPALVKKRLYGMITEGFFVDIGIPSDYSNLCSSPGELLKVIDNIDKR